MVEKDNLNAKNYFHIIVSLRGLAALAVCMFHFTKGFVNEDGLVRQIFGNGWMGVEVFFVISGFVIPFSLLGTTFRIGHYVKFLKKRFLRIEPAYLISVLLIVILNYVSSHMPGFRGESLNFSFVLLLEHVGYLVRFFNNEWLNPVYWTLEIEFHYYLIIGVLIALWNLKVKWIIFISILGLLLLSFWNQEIVPFFKYTDLFVLGILAAFYKKEQLKLVPFLGLILILGFIISNNHGIIISVLTITSAVLISFFSHFGNTKLLIFFGNISYSLYLLHVPIGGKLINLSKRLELNEVSKFGVILMALVLSTFAAWLFYQYIEKPSHQWAKKVTFD